MDLVIDIGNTRVKCALFEGDTLKEAFGGENLKKVIENTTVERTLVSSVNPQKAHKVEEILRELGIKFEQLKVEDFLEMLDVVDKNEVGADRIANIYGALYHFPVNDCIVVDIGTAITFDYVTKEGKYLGGAIYPGLEISADGLHEGTESLPRVKIVRPEKTLGKTTVEHIQSGIYFGMLGAIERVVDELRRENVSPSSMMVLATGGMTENEALEQDLLDFVDVVDPYLTLVGLKEILKE